MVLQFIESNVGTRQLYHNHFIYHRHRQAYWKCVVCEATIGTTGETEQDDVRVPKYLAARWKTSTPDEMRRQYIDIVAQKHRSDCQVTPCHAECIKAIQRMLGENNWLLDTHILFDLELIQRAFPQISYQDPVLLAYNVTGPLAAISDDCILIVCVSSHWVTLTNINHFDRDDDMWILYDSLNDPKKYLKDLKPLFRRIRAAEGRTRRGRFVVKSVKVKKQLGSSDCGLFALAYAYELANGQNPALCAFDQHKMRSHFNSILKTRQIVSFPHIKLSSFLEEPEVNKLNLS